VPCWYSQPTWCSPRQSRMLPLSRAPPCRSGPHPSTPHHELGIMLLLLLLLLLLYEGWILSLVRFCCGFHNGLKLALA